jgi:hypothetical protein
MYTYYLRLLESMFRRDPTRHHSGIISALTTLAQTYPQFAAEISSKFAENQFSSTLQQFLSNTPTKHHLLNLQCTLTSPCAIHTTKQFLTADVILCKFLVTLNFHSALLDVETLFPALEKLLTINSLLPQLTCPDPHLRPPVIPALLEETSTQLPDPPLSWKDSLCTELLRDANSKYSSIIHVVGTICRDLQARCDEVEAPLRVAESELAEVKSLLAQERDVAEETCAELRSRVRELGEQNEGLVVEVKCVREETEGWKRGVEGEMAEERGMWGQREAELVRTNEVLDEEVKEMRGLLEELSRQVGLV